MALAKLDTDEVWTDDEADDEEWAAAAEYDNADFATPPASAESPRPTQSEHLPTDQTCYKYTHHQHTPSVFTPSPTTFKYAPTILGHYRETDSFQTPSQTRTKPLTDDTISLTPNR